MLGKAHGNSSFDKRAPGARNWLIHLLLKYISCLFAPSATTASATQRCRCSIPATPGRTMHIPATHGMIPMDFHKRDTGYYLTARYGNQVATWRPGMATRYGFPASRWFPPEMVPRQTSCSHQTGAPHLGLAAMPRVPRIEAAREPRSTRAKKDGKQETEKGRDPRR